MEDLGGRGSNFDLDCGLQAEKIVTANYNHYEVMQLTPTEHMKNTSRLKQRLQEPNIFTRAIASSLLATSEADL